MLVLIFTAFGRLPPVSNEMELSVVVILDPESLSFLMIDAIDFGLTFFKVILPLVIAAAIR